MAEPGFHADIWDVVHYIDTKRLEKDSVEDIAEEQDVGGEMLEPELELIGQKERI